MLRSFFAWRKRSADQPASEAVEAATPVAALPPSPAVQASIPLSTITRDSEFWSSFVENARNGLPIPTETSARALSAVTACVNLISGALMRIPANVFDRAPNGDLTKRENDELWWILNEQFTPRWPASAGWEYLGRSLLLQGDAFAEIRRGPLGEIKGILPHHPRRVVVVPTPDGERLLYAIDPEFIGGKVSGKTRVLDQDDMLHVPGAGFDGTRSSSVLKHELSAAGGTALALQDFVGRYFANGARPDYTINSEGNVAPELIDKLYATLELYKGFQNAHRPMVLTGGLKIDPIELQLEDLQLLESRKFQVEEIARIFGVPPFMIGHTEKTSSWGSGVEHMGIGFVRYSLGPHIERFQTELNRKLFRTGRRVIRFDTTDLERADIKTLMESLRIGLGRAGEKPLMSQNEARRVLRLPDFTGGDDMTPMQSATLRVSQGDNYA